MALLEVEDLHVGFPASGGEMVEVLRGISFSVDTGEVVGLAGESGSGKSQTALAIMRLLKSPGRILKGSIRFDGIDLARAPEARLRQIRGAAISMVFQDALTALNPGFTIGAQMINVIRAHRDIDRRAASDIAVESLQTVGIPDPAARLGQYPHQFSGGMRQRVLIAMAIACRPRLLIADEPTTALDVSVQAQIIRLLAELRQRLGLAMIFITHNLDLMAQLSDRAIILYGGSIMEEAAIADLFAAPRHPYTRLLLNCIPRLTDTPGDLHTIEGAAPVAGQVGAGCPFLPRCAAGTGDCRRMPPLTAHDGGRRIACWHPAP